MEKMKLKKVDKLKKTNKRHTFDKSSLIIFIFINIISIIILFCIEIYKLNKNIENAQLSYIKEKNIYLKSNNSINILQNQLNFINGYKPNPQFIIDPNKYNHDYLQLYIENKTEFYIYRRKKIMNKIGRDYDDSNILTFQDKLNWLIIHESPEYKSKIADKILMREYSKKILGKDICIPIIKIYNNIDEINLNDLPEKFTLNCNHGYNMSIICDNKVNFNLYEAKNKLAEWMRTNYGLYSSEFQFIYIKKKIYAEEYFGEMNKISIYCFNGNPKFIKGKGRNYYDINWELTDIDPYQNGIEEKIYDKPKNLEIMLDYARKLSEKFVFLKVNFYEKNNLIYLCDLNFSPSNVKMTFKNRAQSLYLGSLLDITKVQNFTLQDD